MAEEAGEKAKGQFGLGSREEEARKAAGEIVSINSAYYRPLENLKWVDFPKLEMRDRLQVTEALRSSVVDSHLSFEKRLGGALEAFNYKTQFYTLQGERERATAQIVMYEGLLSGAKEGQNERLLGLEIAELERHESAIKVAEWALPYKTKYYSGMESMGLLAERGGQLYLGDMSRVLQGVDAEWINSQPETLDPAKYPAAEVQKRAEEIKEWNEIKDQLPLVEDGQTVADRYAGYVADTDFFMRIVGEMNTYNPTIPGEKINISETMQQFVGDLLRKNPRTYEDGKPEVIKNPTRQIEVYLDDNGEQVPFAVDAQSGQIRPAGIEDKNVKKAYVEIVDYYNGKARSEEEMRLLICTISALAIHDAKGVLESLPSDIASAKTAQDSQQGSVYNQLFSLVQKTAKEMVDNFDIPRKKDFNHKLARSAFYLADSIAFGSFDIGERGWGYGWKQVKVYDPTDKDLPKDKQRILGYKWKTVPSQGDPTASGDAFTAAKPYFHDVVYQAIKSRVSSFGQGVNPPVDAAEGEKMAQVFVSEAAEINDRRKTIEMIQKGKHQYLATYFGVLGAFEKELGALPAWQDGKKKREKFGKKVNPNLSKAVEQYVVFAPTPFSFKHVNLNNTEPNNQALINYVKSTGLTHGENVIFPMLAPQQKIGLFDMLSAGKEITVGDLLRKLWVEVEVPNPDGSKHIELREADPEKNEVGKRRTLKDIDWKLYARYADDSRAVNDHFMLQLFSPVYGALNSKQLEAVAQNPMLAITSAIKAADISMRTVIKKVDDPGNENKVTRPSLEIIHGAAIAFQQLALGVHGLIGRGKVTAYKDFVDEITPKEQKKQSNNLYTILRAAEDLVPNKEEYKNYSDSWCSAFMAMAFALEPVTIASNEMAADTTTRFFDYDPTGSVHWDEIAKSQDTKKTPLRKKGSKGV